jgi:uncharacterized protein (TIGR02466 family)
MIVHKIFPTAVLEFDLSDNPVVQNIKELIDKKESIQASEHGLIDHGVSSFGKKNLLDEEEFIPLKRVFEDGFKQYSEEISLGNIVITNSWYNKYLYGGRISAHRHEGSVVSATFYPYVDDGSSNIRFHSPLKPYRMNEIFHDENYYNTYFWEFPAKKDTLYLFPGWLEHETHVNFSNERYVISFNTKRVD